MSTNNQHRFHESNIALAGLCQASALVKQIARNKEFDNQALMTSLNSISITDSENTEQVFGNTHQLTLGYQTLLEQLSNQSTNKDVEITRYIANLLSIERKLSASNKTMASLGERISNIQRQQLHLDITDSQMLSNLASIYTDVVSPVTRKIQVAGDPEILKRTDTQHRVRAILLAGVRAAVLWRQLGGKRRHILFSRQQILDSAEHTLNNISTSK
ncbi:MAG: high frequency lysogenization protein [Oceanospirillaceae bacterium]|jgi:high frequency lysogenization protein